MGMVNTCSVPPLPSPTWGDSIHTFLEPSLLLFCDCIELLLFSSLLHLSPFFLALT